MFKQGLLLLLSLASLQFGVHQIRSSPLFIRHQEFPILAQLPVRIIPTLLLGHKRFYDDYIFLWALQYLIEEKSLAFSVRESLSPEEIAKKIDVLAQIQPKVESFYLLSCFRFAFDFHLPKKCQSWMTLGIEALPQSWRIPMTQGFIYAYLLDDEQKASELYTLASTKPKSPPFLSSFGEKLKTKIITPEDQEAARKLLEELIPHEKD